MAEISNPYSPPGSNVRMAESQSHIPELLFTPRAVQTGAGLSWFTKAWPLFKQDIGIWILITLAFFVINILLGFVPFIGSVIATVLGPVLMGGIMLGARAADQGKPLDFMILFAGFKDKFLPLLGLGGLSLLIVLVATALLSIAFWALMAHGSVNLATFLADTPPLGLMLTIILVSLILCALVSMLFLYATPLVALNNVPVFKSLAMSFKGSLLNMLPLFVLSLIVMLLGILCVFTFGLGMLVVFPLLTIAIYLSYKNIFLK